MARHENITSLSVIPVGTRPIGWRRIKYILPLKGRSIMIASRQHAVCTSSDGKGIWLWILASALLFEADQQAIHSVGRNAPSRIFAQIKLPLWLQHRLPAGGQTCCVWVVPTLFIARRGMFLQSQARRFSPDTANQSR